MRQLLLSIFLVLNWSLVQAGDMFHGLNFKVELPVAPNVSYSKMQGSLGEADSWKYQGTYTQSEVTVSYGIEYVHAQSSIFLLASEEQIADILVNRVLTAAGPMYSVIAAGKLPYTVTKGGFGVEVIYWNGDLYRLRVIVSKPRVWLLTVVAVGGNEKAVKLQDEIFKTFVIHDPKSAA